MNEYDHTQPTRFSLVACEAAVGMKVTLPLTGKIIEAKESPAGPFVRVLIDERWGYGPEFVLGIDLDALTVHP